MRDLKQNIEIMSKESKFKSVRGLILFILLLLGHSVSNATTITGYLRDVSGAPYSAARVEFQPISAPSYSNNAVYIGISKSVAAPRGEISVGLVGGWYQTFFHPTTNQITIYVPTTGSYSLAQVATNLVNVQNPYGYTPGTNIVFETNTSSGLISINSSGGGSGTTYTNNTGLPGVIVGSGIGTNLATVALKSDATNAAFGALIANNVITNGRTTSATIGGVVLSGTGIVTANSFIGDGSSLTGVGVSASEVAAIMATNNGLSFPQNVNAGFSQRFVKSIADTRQATILNYGDDQINLTAGMWRCLEASFTNRSAGPAYGSSAFSYRTAAGINTLYQPKDCAAAGILPLWTYGLGNGGSFTNRHITDQGFTTENIIVNYYASSNFGSYTIRTQKLGGAIGDFRTVSANNGSTLALAYTNWTIPPIQNLIVSIVSSGSNLVANVGQTLTNNQNQTWSWDDFEDQNVRLTDFTATTSISNMCGRFFASNRIDVMIVHDLYTTGATTSNDWRIIQSNFQNCLSNYSVFTDVIYITPVPIITPSLSAETLAQRDSVLATSRLFDVRAFDAYNTMLPVLRSLSNELYWASDNLHLSNSANAYLTAQLADTFGFSPASISAVKSVFTDKANLVGGNLLSGNQLLSNGSLTVTNGNLQIQRTGGSYTRVVSRNDFNILSILDSGSGDAVFLGITNTFGTVTMGGVFTTTLGGPNWSYLGNSASFNSVSSTNINYTQAAVFPTNAISLGVVGATNISQIAYRGYLITVATNRAVGGWMWQTNGQSGIPAWGAFNPASQP